MTEQTPWRTTTTGLLRRLGDPADEAVWRAFDARYRPVIHGLARRLGLTDDEAADVAQDALVQFVEGFRAGRYDRDRGRLRSWLIGIARLRMIDVQRRWVQRRERRGESALAGIPHESDLEPLWRSAERHAILRAALDELRATTKTSEASLQAFDALAVRRRDVRAVAEELGMSVAEAYKAKNRVAARLRAIVGRIEATYE